MSKIILITGATSGFGLATAHRFALNGYKLIVTGRREELLQKIQQELEKKYATQVLTLAFDIRNQQATEKAIEQLPEVWKQIDVLINNAGLAAGRAPIQDGLIADWDQMIDTNLKGLLYITRAVSPLMIARKKGHIVNIGSIAGKEVYPDGNVYCATKFGVDALTRAIRIDLVKHNIKVTGICPGAAETEFSLVRFKGDEQKAKEVYNGFKPLQAEDVADAIWYCTQLPAHVTINDLVIMPTAQASSMHFNKE